MRVPCEVEIIYSLALAGGGAPCKSSRSRASVGLGKKTRLDSSSTLKRRKEEVFLTVSTAKNLEGTQYKVKNNITKIFTRFVQEGKATIKFKDPAHDIAISKTPCLAEKYSVFHCFEKEMFPDGFPSADPDKLKELLGVLRLNPRDQCETSLSLLQPTKKEHVEKPKAKLVVKTRGEYPIRGFPDTLESVQAVGISLNRIDRRILQLRNIRSIDLSNNSIMSFPECIKDVRLVELKLSGNKISEFPEVICSGEITKSLRLLDLARNQLTYLPHKFSSFKSLVQLRLDCNELQVLPRTFGKMVSLKYFSASNNKLVVLPPSFPKLTLDSLDLFGNPFSASGLVRTCKNLSLPSLKELAGRVIKMNKIPYDPYTLPVVLCHYLDAAKKCLCGKPCMDAYLHYVATLNLHKVSATVTATDKNGTTSVPVETFLCSAKCRKLWKL